ncbi:MAG: TlpA family protein disulfide reductase [Nannocystaceae bacterium]|nr:TlpA family protein disulfide reductase [Nannocystaceae bacterium]
MRSWEVAAWANTPPLTLAELRGQVVVVRFWTDTCPFCEASMPALAGLAEQFADQPVVFVGLYHAKPRNRVGAWRAAQKVAKDWGVAFPIGHDADWAMLRSWWLSTGDRSATSATIVLGTQGEVIHVHPGPVYFPSDDEQYAQENQDFVALRDAISRGIVGRK